MTDLAALRFLKIITLQGLGESLHNQGVSGVASQEVAP